MKGTAKGVIGELEERQMVEPLEVGIGIVGLYVSYLDFQNKVVKWLYWDKNLGRDRSWAYLGQDSLGHEDKWVKRERERQGKIFIFKILT